MAPTTKRRLLLSSLHCPLCCQLDARSKHPEIFSLCEPEHLQGPCMYPTASDSCRMETRSTSMPIHVWQRCLCSLPHAELFEAGRFLTSSGPGRTWVLAPIASRPVRISFLVFGTHLPSDCFVSLEPYGATGQISQLLPLHVSEELCIRYRKGAGIASLVAAGRCATTMKGLYSV